MIFTPSKEDLQLLLKAECHRGSEGLQKKVSPYVFKKSSAGKSHIFDLNKTWQKIHAAARLLVTIGNPKDICLVSSTTWGQRSIFKFSQYTGSYSISGRYTPGTFTNQICKSFREPLVLIVCDPKLDIQPIKEASYVNIPVIACCDTDSPFDYIDLAIPCNNKSKHSISAIFYLLCREVLKMRREITPEAPWNVKVDLFIYKEADELEKMIANDKAVIEKNKMIEEGERKRLEKVEAEAAASQMTPDRRYGDVDQMGEIGPIQDRYDQYNPDEMSIMAEENKRPEMEVPDDNGQNIQSKQNIDDREFEQGGLRDQEGRSYRVDEQSHSQISDYQQDPDMKWPGQSMQSMPSQDAPYTSQGHQSSQGYQDYLSSLKEYSSQILPTRQRVNEPPQKPYELYPRYISQGGKPVGPSLGASLGNQISYQGRRDLSSGRMMRGASLQSVSSAEMGMPSDVSDRTQLQSQQQQTFQQQQLSQQALQQHQMAPQSHQQAQTQQTRQAGSGFPSYPYGGQFSSPYGAQMGIPPYQMQRGAQPSQGFQQMATLRGMRTSFNRFDAQNLPSGYQNYASQRPSFPPQEMRNFERKPYNQGETRGQNSRLQRGSRR